MARRRGPGCKAALARVAAGAALLAGEGRALAYDALASGCEEDPWQCQVAPIAFHRNDALPIEWSFDTGWVPQGADLQVHLWAGIYASTEVSLTGELETTWLEALTLRAPGDPVSAGTRAAPLGGKLGFHYGVEVGAEAMVSITVGGQTYSWTGDIPYVPQVDLQVQAEGTFDAWGWEPGVGLSSTTEPQRLASVGIGDLIGGSIPGIDGGFELDVALELEATYRTDRLVIATTDGEVVSGGPITADDLASLTGYLGGPSVELDVHPEGVVDYEGVIHLIPAFYVELLGQSFSIPIADIPIPFPITQTAWVFDAQRVHVPLPDLVVSDEVIDFGEVEVGQKSLVAFSMYNAGEAPLRVLLESADVESFPTFDDEILVDPWATIDSAVRFTPQHPGAFEAVLLLASNDPSDPVQQITLRGTAHGGVAGAVPHDEPEVIGEDGSCGCRVVGAGGPRADARGGWLAVVAAGLLRRRRRVVRRTSGTITHR